MTNFPRPSRALQRWVLLCLVFSWGIVFSSPMPPSKGMTEVCTTSGTQWVPVDDGSDQVSTHTTGCSFCLPAALPSPAAAAAPTDAGPSHSLLTLDASSPPPAPAAMPPPARGPPLFPSPTQEVHS